MSVGLRVVKCVYVQANVGMCEPSIVSACPHYKFDSLRRSRALPDLFCKNNIAQSKCRRGIGNRHLSVGVGADAGASL